MLAKNPKAKWLWYFALLGAALPAIFSLRSIFGPYPDLAALGGPIIAVLWTLGLAALFLTTYRLTWFGLLPYIIGLWDLAGSRHQYEHISAVIELLASLGYVYVMVTLGGVNRRRRENPAAT